MSDDIELADPLSLALNVLIEAAGKVDLIAKQSRDQRVGEAVEVVWALLDLLADSRSSSDVQSSPVAALATAARAAHAKLVHRKLPTILRVPKKRRRLDAAISLRSEMERHIAHFGGDPKLAEKLAYGMVFALFTGTNTVLADALHMPLAGVAAAADTNDFMQAVVKITAAFSEYIHGVGAKNVDPEQLVQRGCIALNMSERVANSLFKNDLGGARR